MQKPPGSSKVPAVLFFGLMAFLAVVGFFVGKVTMQRPDPVVAVPETNEPFSVKPHSHAVVDAPAKAAAQNAPARSAATRPDAAPPIEPATRARADRSEDERDADPDAVAARDAEEIRIRELRDSARVAPSKP